MIFSRTLIKLQIRYQKRVNYTRQYNYARTNKEELYTFLEDGKLELTNNLAKRSQKPLIIGRKNSMFMGSARGAQSSAVIQALSTIGCSLVESAKENGSIPRRYLNHLEEELPLMEEAGEYELERLMPWHQNVQKSCSAKEGRHLIVKGICLFF